MKKLLSLLSLLTISGNAVPTTIATSSYKKEEILNSEIIFLQTNNLDKKVYLIEDKPNNYDAIEISGIKGQVNDIAIHDRNIHSTVAGAIYFATNDGLYFKSRPSSNLIKINGINNSVNRIIISQSTGETYAITADKKVYLIEDKPNNYDAIEISEIKGQVNDIAIHDRNVHSTVAGAIYFATNDGLYFKSRPSSNLIKINGINNSVNRIIISQSTGETYAITADKKVYLIEDKPNNYDAIEISEIKGQVNDIAIHDRNVHSTVAGAIYFATNDGLYFKSRPSSNLIKINGINNSVNRIIISQSTGEAYAITADKKVYLIEDKPNNYDAIEISEIKGQVNDIAIHDRNVHSTVAGAIYFATNDGLYFKSRPSSNLIKINGINNSVNRIIISQSTGETYAITTDKKQNLSNVIKNSELEKLNNSNQKTILSQLNYLNPDLDISQLEIINKTDTSAIIKIKNNKDFDKIIVNYKIKNKDEISTINLNELIKKAIFFKFRDENPNLKFKEIKDINNNLIFSNVEVTKKENSFSSSVDFKNICNNKEFINKTSNIKLFNIPVCIHNSKYKLTFQILTGLIKNKENKLNGWNIDSDDEVKLTEFINSNYDKNSYIINELSNNFDLANTNKQEQEMIIYFFNESSDKFEVNPNEKLQVNYSPLRIVKSKNILNLKQKITGIIISKIIDDNNEEQIITLSIKEAMQILQKYSLLPDEIIINKDNNITFNGKAVISDEIEGKIKQSIITSIV